MTKGLYFYKLVSPYSEDITKDCKLTINEIDSNFINLKDVDIKEVRTDNEKKRLILTRNNEEELVFDLSEMVNHTLDVDFDSIDGVLTLEYNGEKYSIEGLITKDNLSKEILTKVYSDCTLKGVGTPKNPLRLSDVYKTGYFKPVIDIVDTLGHDKIPHKNLKKGDRYLVRGEVHDYGLLYNFKTALYINKLLEKTGWRVPTKEDWDNMLNALEPCEHRNHNSTLNNHVLGKMAGSLLKSVDGWRTKEHHCHNHHEHNHGDFFDVHDKKESEFFDVEERHECHHHPKEKPMSSEGKDAFGMTIYPVGYAYKASPLLYREFGYQGAYWTTDALYDTDIYAKVFEADESGVLQIGERPSAYLGIRLVKDYDGTNHEDIEDILGTNYKTVLLPSLNKPSGFTIWTAQNFDFRDNNVEFGLPNGGFEQRKHIAYFIYEWNGFKWERLELSEGDSVTVLKGKKPNESYRIIEGRLKNITKYISDTLKEEFAEVIDNVKVRLKETEKKINEHENHLNEVDSKIDDIENDIANIESNNAEQDERLSTLENGLEETNKNLQTEISRAQEVEAEIWKGLNGEIERAQEVEGQLWGGINGEIERAQSVEEQLWSGLNGEIERAQEVEKEIWEALETEAKTREEVDNQQWDAITEEIKTRQEEDEKLDKRVVDLEGRVIKVNECNYDETEGVLTLPTENEENTIKVKFSFDFGDC